MRPLRIGICCYPTFGGSGIVATEIGLAMAARGHRVHFVSTGVPRRLGGCPSNVTLHEVSARDYPVFSAPPMSLAMASRLVEVATWEKLDVLHVHYAIPHAASAVMAKDILGDLSPKVVTTLHGTDITIVGGDGGYRPVIRWAIERSDAVTVPSQWLKEETVERIGVNAPIEVIPNFVDVARYSAESRDREVLRALFARNGHERLAPEHPVLIHVSNFRPVKRVEQVIDVFAQVNAWRESRLVLVGDGPDRSRAESRARRLGLEHRVRFLGKVRDFVPVLRATDAFLLPSETESFGLAALEAQACGVPVFASDVGGMPEVVDDGVTGRLTPMGDTLAMARAVKEMLSDADRAQAMRDASRARAVEHFQPGPAVDRYEALYRRLVG